MTPHAPIGPRPAYMPPSRKNIKKPQIDQKLQSRKFKFVSFKSKTPDFK